jgi:hypothetical protein
VRQLPLTPWQRVVQGFRIRPGNRPYPLAPVAVGDRSAGRPTRGGEAE